MAFRESWKKNLLETGGRFNARRRDKAQIILMATSGIPGIRIPHNQSRH